MKIPASYTIPKHVLVNYGNFLKRNHRRAEKINHRRYFSARSKFPYRRTKMNSSRTYKYHHRRRT
uniref:Uncharacterized protein n=1 Tax=Arundo donax TaxID=35708 RepID=A0A0A8XZT5_ARUDO